MIKTWIFTRTIHRWTESEDDSWEFAGTKEQAEKEYNDILARSWSPFVTFKYEEKK